MRARARLSSLFGRDRERRDGGFERNARKRTGRAGGREGWMVARALFERVFDARDVYKSASVSPFLGLPTHHRDGLMQKTHRHVSFSLSLSLFALAIDYNNNNSRKTRPKKTPWSPTRRKRRKSVQKVLLPWRRPRTTPQLKTDKLVDLFLCGAKDVDSAEVSAANRWRW